MVSAAVQTLALQRIKAGNKSAWQAGAAIALVLGLAAVVHQIWQLTDLPFWPGASGFASVFVGCYPVFSWRSRLLRAWSGIEILIMRCRAIPEISFVERPPTYAEALRHVQQVPGLPSAPFTVDLELHGGRRGRGFSILFYLVH